MVVKLAEGSGVSVCLAQSSFHIPVIFHCSSSPALALSWIRMIQMGENVFELSDKVNQFFIYFPCVTVSLVFTCVNIQYLPLQVHFTSTKTDTALLHSNLSVTIRCCIMLLRQNVCVT